MSMIRTDIKDGLALVTLAHGKANALDTEFCLAIAETFEGFGQDVRGVVLTGSGNIFSAGVDLVRMSSEDLGYVADFLPAFDRAILALFNYTRPLVAAVNGHAIAGGCLVACTADYRIMADGAFRIGVPELKVGVPFPPAALEVLRFATPERYMQELASGEKIYDAEEALTHGLVHKVVPAEDLLEAATREATRLVSLQARAFSLTKAMLRRPVVDRIAYLNDVFGNQVKADWTSDETRKAIGDYVQKTLRNRS
jgi:enoyl-CoA hydratase